MPADDRQSGLLPTLNTSTLITKSIFFLRIRFDVRGTPCWRNPRNYNVCPHYTKNQLYQLVYRRNQSKQMSYYTSSLNLNTLVFVFNSHTLHFLWKWNSYSHIPEPLNLVPNLPRWPRPHVPTLLTSTPSRCTQTTHSTHNNNWERGSKRGEGRGEHMLWSLPGLSQCPVNKKLRGRIWSTE